MLKHAAAIKCLETEVVSLDHMSTPVRNVVSQSFADECVKRAAAIRETIEFLKKDQNENP